LFRAKSPITGAIVEYDSHAFVLPMSRDDLIIGMDNIVQHMIPLTIELLLAAQREHNGSSTPTFPAYIPAIEGDVYALAAMDGITEETASSLDQLQTVPLEPWNKTSKMVQAPIHKKLYQPLKGEQEAPEDQVHVHAGIFGNIDELTTPGYTSAEAFAARRKEVLTAVDKQVYLAQEDPACNKFKEMLKGNIAAFVC